MADQIEIRMSVQQAEEYIDRKRDQVAQIIEDRIDAFNVILSDRLDANLSGGVLQQRSGLLRSTLGIREASRSGDIISGDVHAGDGAPYGEMLDKGGTRAYEIRPVKAEALFFQMNGKNVFAKVVHHPPIPHLPWWTSAIGSEDEARNAMSQQIQSGIEEVLKQ